MKPERLCWILLVVLLLAGSAFAARNLPVEPGTGLAYGAFDISDSDLAVTHVVLLRIKPTKMYMGGSGERATVTYTQGEFYSPNLSPGVYAVNGFYSGNKFFALERNLRTNTFEVQPGRVSYAGSYKLTLAKGGLFRRDKGSFDRVDTPGDRARLLQWLGGELAGTAWAPAVSAGRTEAQGK